jgi:hypothetical protein
MTAQSIHSKCNPIQTNPLQTDPQLMAVQKLTPAERRWRKKQQQLQEEGGAPPSVPAPGRPGAGQTARSAGRQGGRQPQQQQAAPSGGRPGGRQQPPQQQLRGEGASRPKPRGGGSKAGGRQAGGGQRQGGLFDLLADADE